MQASRWPRIAGVSGIVAAVLMFVGLLLLDLDDVGPGASRAEVISTYSADAVERKKEIGATLVGFGIFFLLVFLGRLRGAVQAAEGVPGVFASAAFAGGLVFAALLGVSAALDTGVVSTEGFFDDYRVDAGTPLVLVSLSNWTRGFAVVGGGVLTGAASVVALRTRLFPRWLAFGGLATAVIAFFGETTTVFGVPILLILLWVVVASALIVREGATTKPAALA